MSEPSIPESLIDLLRSSRSIAVLTGAGVSAESNIPTFRDAQTGLWAQYEPTELATPEAFRANPKLVWDWYAWRKTLVEGAEPNPAHHALARMQELVNDWTLITQNVDGLHQQAGSRDVVELHGNIRRYKCFTENRVVDGWPETEATPPPCPHCGGYLRPDVVWFNEMLPADALRRAGQAATRCEIFLSIGTSALVYPAAGLVLDAKANGAVTVEVNPVATPHTKHLDYALQGPAGQILPRLVAAVWGP